MRRVIAKKLRHVSRVKTGKTSVFLNFVWVVYCVVSNSRHKEERKRIEFSYRLPKFRYAYYNHDYMKWKITDLTKSKSEHYRTFAITIPFK